MFESKAEMLDRIKKLENDVTDNNHAILELSRSGQVIMEYIKQVESRMNQKLSNK